MDRQLIKNLRPVLQAHLDKLDLSDLGGAVIEVRNAKFDSATVTFQVSVTPGGKAALADKDKEDFEQYCGAFGLKAEYFGKVFTNDDRRQYKVVGLKLGRGRFPVLCERLDGSGARYKFAADSVVRGLDPELWAKRRSAFGGVKNAAGRTA